MKRFIPPVSPRDGPRRIAFRLRLGVPTQNCRTRIDGVPRALNSANTVRMPKITRDHYTAVRRNRTLWSVGLPATAPGLHWLEKRKSPLPGAVGFDIKRGEAITSRYQRGACGLRRFPPRPWRHRSSNRPAGLPCPAPEPCTARRSA